MVRFKLFATILVVTAASAIPAFAQTSSNTWTIDPMHSQATFEVRHLSVSNVRGSINGVSGTVVWDPKDPSHDSVNAVLDATTVDTGNGYRDKDLKSDSFFDVAKYPTLTFQSTSVKRAKNGLEVTGNLTLAGETHPVVLEVTQPAAPGKGMNGGLVTGLEATTTVQRTDFNFGGKYPDAIVSNAVKLVIDVEMDQK